LFSFFDEAYTHRRWSRLNGRYLVVVGDDVLPQLGPDGFEQIPQVADDGKVPEDRVLALDQVVDDDQGEQAQHDHDDGHRGILRDT
jgi:hypothetical protein